MRRCLLRHRFALALALLIPLAAVASSSTNPRPASVANSPVLRSFARQTSLPGRPAPQTSQSQTSLPGKPTAPFQPSEQTRTEQYTLSHERYEKAVAYSRAGYTLYFVSYFLGGLFLFLILRLGIAARFRDIAENASDNRWVQGLIFVPLLLVLVDVLDLPVQMYWHRLSLHYEQSIQGWGAWFWDWT
jgi:hypothetical protein